MLLIYTPNTNNRIKYTFDLIFKYILVAEFRITVSEEEFINYEGPKINYSKQRFSDEIFFFPSELLFESGINGREISFLDFKDSKAFFPVYNKDSALPFDPFAASFYMVSRYEEYLPYIRDKYGRFHASESMAMKNGFLHKPVVNIWAREIGKIIKKRHREFITSPQKYKHLPTIDVDVAFAYKYRCLLRTTGAYIKSLLNFDFKTMAERTKVIFGYADDPFDTYSYQIDIHNRYNLKAAYFILFGNYGEYDKNIFFQNHKYHELIKSLADYADVGIHPSYSSNDDPKKLKKETELLSQVLKKEITISRQHYLKIDLPITYRNLLNLGISHDYSMGFAIEPGFRAGICTSFNFYDLDMDNETALRVHPFTVMDGTLCDYKEMSPDQAINEIKSLIDEVKAVDGEFISLWHNDSLSETGRWKGWRKVYEEMLKYSTIK